MPAESGKFAIGASVEQARSGGQQGPGPGWRMAPEDAREAERKWGRQGWEGSRPPEMAQWQGETESERGERERESARTQARQREKMRGRWGDKASSVMEKVRERERKCYGRSLYA